MAYDDTPQPAAPEPALTLANLFRSLENQYRGLSGERDELQKRRVQLDMRLQDLDQMCEALMAAISYAKEHLPHAEPPSEVNYVPGHIL